MKGLQQTVCGAILWLNWYYSGEQAPHVRYMFLTLCSRVVNLIKYPLVPEQFKFFEFSTPNCTITYVLTL
jgi:hypothetical protein